MQMTGGQARAAEMKKFPLGIEIQSQDIFVEKKNDLGIL